MALLNQDMYQLAGLLSQMPTFSGRPNPLRGTAPLLFGMGQQARVDAENQKKQQALQSMLLGQSVPQAGPTQPGQTLPNIQQGGLISDPQQQQLYQGLLDAGYGDQVVGGLLNQQAPDMTGLQKNLLSMGIQPGTPQWNDYMQRIMLKPDTLIDMGEQRLSVSDAKSLVDDKGNHPPPGSLWRDIDQTKYKITTPAQIANEDKLAGASQVLNKMVSLYFDPQNPLYFEGGMVERGVKGFKNIQDLMSQGNTNASAYYALAQGSIAPLVKALGETGNLATEDIARAQKLISDLATPDSKQVATEKFSQLFTIIKKGLGRNSGIVSPIQVINGKTYINVNGEWYEQ
jgi:hypothetical protein